MRVVVGLVLLALFGVAGCADGSSQDYSFAAPGGQTRILYDPPPVRGRAPDLAGEQVLEPGRSVSTADFPGQVMVINVWGSWCGPCRRETPALERVFTQTHASGVQFLGVDVRDEVRSAAEDFLRDRAVTYPSIYDPPGRSLFALRGYPRNVVPSTIVLDRQHRVAAVFLTALTADDLLPLVQRLAAEPRTAPPAAPAAPAVPRPQPSAWPPGAGR